MVQRLVDNTVDQQRATGARLQAADFGEGRAVVQGAQQFARGLDEARDNFDRIGQQYDEAVVKNADAEDLKTIIQIRAEAMASQGLEAPGAIKAAQEKIDEIQRQRLSTFSNSRQRQLYDDVFKARSLQMSEQFITHSVKQVQEATKTAAISRATAYSDLAVDTYGTDEFDVNIQTALSEVATVNRGMPPEVIQRKQAEVRSQVLSRVVSGMLTTPDNVQEANLLLEEHAADILPEDEQKLRKAINPILEEDQTEVDAGRAFSSSPTPAEETEDPLAPAPAVAASAQGPRVAVEKHILGGKGRVTETAQGHRARGSGNALDIAAPEGTPIYPPMSGKVLKKWHDDRGGYSIAIEHPNGYVTGYAHMRGPSPLEVGDPVESNSVIGSVGSTGKSTGPHVHFTARQSRGGPKVDPSVLDWSNKVNPKSVSWKEGPLQKFEPEENQLGRALERLHTIATSENWSPRRYQRAVDRARQIAGVQDQVAVQNSQANYEVALGKVAELGDGLTSVSQIPNYAALKPGHKIAIQNIIKGNKAGASDPDAASADYFRYFDQAMNPATREQFSKADLLSNPNLTNGERKQLFTMQWEIRNDKTGKLSASLDEASSMANRYLPKGDFDNEQRQRFQDAYMRRISEAQRGRNNQLTDQEKSDIAKALVVPVVRYSRTPEGEKKLGKGLFFEYQGPGKERAEVDVEQVYSSIPVETHDRIRMELKRNGQRHSKQDIVRAFLEMAR